jgi:uncharacterized protein with NAD-binding domain and iron-sulfur cluster
MNEADAGGDGRTRVAVLGGGPAGLAAAFGLSATPGLRARYDVTIYEAGWRVGGKCGQGRDANHAWRVEQNGTHYVFGAYDNVFQTARQAFDELAAAGDTRFGSFESNFIPRSLLAMKQFFNGDWATWALEIPRNDLPPGSGGAEPTLAAALETGLSALLTHHAAHGSAARPGGGVDADEHHTWRARLGALAGRELDHLEDLAGAGLLKLAHELVRLVDVTGARGGALEAIVWLLRRFRGWLWGELKGLVGDHVDALRLWVLADFGCTVLIGIIEDDVFAPGRMAELDRYDLREWLQLHGASELTLYSAPVITWYNAIAAYEGGDVRRPDMSAAAGLQAMLRLSLTYKGAFAYQMSNEVGESVVAPVYQALRNRGVRFMFFHRVRDVRPSADGSRIDTVEVERLVELKSGEPASYEPFVTLPDSDRPVWPDRPLADQIAGASDFDPPLDSFYTPARGVRVELQRGRDFDVAIYALPVATIAQYCTTIVGQRPEWRAMVEGLATVETQSLRVWLKPDLAGLGWELPPPVLSGFFQPLATWEDNAQLISAERWPADAQPGAIGTVFGPLDASPAPYPPPDDHGYPARRLALATETALRFCRYFAGSLWPGVADIRLPPGMDFDQLVVLDQRLQGEARFAEQSVRANVGPSEAYTQIRKGTLGLRLRADGSGYANLFLAGDWVRNGYEIGSVEGAVMAGLQASRAICGSPAAIPGSEGV